MAVELPKVIRVQSVPYTILYFDDAYEVDPRKREASFGWVDFWEDTIRIFKGSRSIESIWSTIWHEVFHIITEHLNIEFPEEMDDTLIDNISRLFNDVLLSNGFIEY